MKRSLIAITCFLSATAFAQDSTVWSNIQIAIHSKSNLQITKDRLEIIKQRSLQENQIANLARSLCYIMLINDQRSEDSLFFRNSAFIDSIIEDPSASPLLKQFMHYMQAQRLWKFRSSYLKFNRQRYETKQLKYNYAAFTNQQLDSIINYHFDQAKKPGNNYSAEEDIIWLSSSPLLFIFKPTLHDIILAEQINFTFSQKTIEIKKTWLDLSPDDFIKVIDTSRKDVFRLYHEWLSLHVKDKAVYYYIESLAHQYIYSIHVSEDNGFDNEKRYEKYLQATIASPFSIVKAHGISELVELWAGHDTAQYSPAKALALYEANRSLFSAYPALQQRMEIAKSNILSKKLRVEMDDISLASEWLKVKLVYKNISHIYYRIIPLYQNEKLPVQQNMVTGYLLKKTWLKEKDELLALPGDHNIHRADIKIDSLPPGKYALLFSYNSVYSYQTFQVSRIAVMHTDDRVYVLDRETGMSLGGAKAVVSYDKKSHAETINDRGYFVLKGEHDYSLSVTLLGDTVLEYADIKKEIPDHVYDKDEYDDLAEYYSENTTLQVFTDRSIYRPGQKVYYKIILLTTNPYTGETQLLNEQNLKKGWSNYLKKWLSEEHPYLYCKDPFGRTVDSVKINPDSYGSVSGFFTIPVTASTGEWDIESDVIDTHGSNRGSFRVEEYKRPTFELTVDKPTIIYTPGDTVSFMVKIRSFSGAVLNNSRITYDVQRSGSSSDYRNLLARSVELIDSIGYTDDKGQLLIRVADTSLKRLMKHMDVPWNFAYALTAEATDPAGETHEVTSRLNVSTRPVSIRMTIPTIYNKDDLRPLLITAKDANGLDLYKKLTVKLYKLQSSSDTAEVNPLTETLINTATFDKFRWPENLTPGIYKLVARAVEDGKILGEQKKIFTIFTNNKATPEDEPFFYVPVTDAAPGDTLRLFSGSPFDTTYSILQIKYLQLKNKKLQTMYFFREKMKTAGVSEWNWMIPQGVKEILLTEIFVINNTLYKHSKNIKVYAAVDEPQIFVEQYRSKMTPGSTETFTVSVKIKDKNIAAQLMSVIYDASLDKLEEHHWRIPYLSNNQYLKNGWDGSLHTTVNSELLFSREPDNQTLQLALQGRMPGVEITNAAGLESVIVTGYGITKKGFLTGSSTSISIRGISSLAGLKQPLIILDGVPFTGDLSTIKTTEITQAMVLQASDAVALYGARAAEGVLIISTKGEIKLPPPPEPPPVKVRGNFNETAFFTPAVYADRDGFYRLTFTMPESVTEWNWKMLAHTKNAVFTYAERKLTTQLQLMVQPNMPRLLCQGDHLFLKSRISNLDTASINGKIACRIEDVVTGMDITNTIIVTPQQTFAVGQKLSSSASFDLSIPANFVHPLKITVIASAKDFADAEEHIIPVVSSKIFVRQSVPFRFFQSDTLISPPKFPGDAFYYGTGLSITPKPQSGLINALPFLANYSWDCAEQTFNKLFAYVTALRIMRTDTAAQHYYAIARSTAEKPGNKLPEEINEQTMPWMNLLNKTSDQQQKLFLLFDTVRTKATVQNYLEKLYKLQQTDGGLAWFEGGKSNDYISNYVLAGFGKLNTDGWVVVDNTRYVKFIKELLSYTNAHFSQQPSSYYCYARSAWNKAYPAKDTLIRKYLTESWKENHHGLYNKALLIISSLRYFSTGDSIHKKAIEELNSLYQLSIRDINGIRWKDISDADDLDHSAEETIALLAEAFSESSYAKEVNPGLIKWLLTTQTEHHWRTTKATAAAINILQQEMGTVIGPSQAVSANNISVTDDLLQGSAYSFIPASTPGNLSIKKLQPQTASGNIIYYYFSANPFTTGDVKLTKKLSLYNTVNKLWQEVTEKTVLKIADKVKVTLTVQTSRPLRYVYIDDKRAAGFEPADNTSGYEYANGFSYYKSVRDAGLQFFSDFIPSGRSEINYEVVVSHEGIFTSAPASLECMYQPAVNAYTGSTNINVSK